MGWPILRLDGVERTRGLSKIRFHDFRQVFGSWQLPNVALFVEQIVTAEAMAGIKAWLGDD